MTDEQLLMFMFGKDISAKAMMFFQQKQQLNYMIQTIKEATAGQFVQQAPPPQTQQQAQREPEFVPQEEEDFSVVSESNNTVSGIKPDIIIAPKKRGRPKR
jgi:hypothetical protein